MAHPIVDLQAALVGALRADEALAGVGVFDAPPKGAVPPWVAVARHDLLPRDGDAAPGFEHRVALHVWVGEPSRKAALAVAARVEAVALAVNSAGTLRVTNARLERVETAIDLDTGRARAVVLLTFFTEAT